MSLWSHSVQTLSGLRVLQYYLFFESVGLHMNMHRSPFFLSGLELITHKQVIARQEQLQFACMLSKNVGKKVVVLQNKNKKIYFEPLTIHLHSGVLMCIQAESQRNPCYYQL